MDTLAPPATSRASIIGHDGGACSISVFNNDIGSGSVSPIIVIGGKNGDIGLHDFRYIATGRTKRHRYRDSGEPSSNTSNADTRTQISDQNLNGMLWEYHQDIDHTKYQFVLNGKQRWRCQNSQDGVHH
ncbi:hypothetical protein SLEP1_g9835 [Rubroshorea leprosula]|uniref:Uncharacterized protein n=1 Tax=Rubroshorea leprosula TaxID=152421 RepID=A0AAV5I655_9ROSI|nr:hypothetical protein SLEP1_g9835 [Rubroshorea leprosula]